MLQGQIKEPLLCAFFLETNFPLKVRRKLTVEAPPTLLATTLYHAKRRIYSFMTSKMYIVGKSKTC